MSIRIIGISGKKQSGKDEICRILKVHLEGYRIAFADALKEEVCAVFRVSLTYLEERKILFRPMLQWWGTDFRRGLNGPDYWIKKMEEKIVPFDWMIKNGRMNQNAVVVIPDVRFKNEAVYIQQCGGMIWRVNRKTSWYDRLGLRSSDNHPSETDLDDFHFDLVIENVGTVAELEAKVVEVLNEEGGRDAG